MHAELACRVPDLLPNVVEHHALLMALCTIWRSTEDIVAPLLTCTSRGGAGLDCGPVATDTVMIMESSSSGVLLLYYRRFNRLYIINLLLLGCFDGCNVLTQFCLIVSFVFFNLHQGPFPVMFYRRH